MIAIATAAASLSILSSLLSITRSVKEFMTSKKISAKDALELFKKQAPQEQSKLLEEKGIAETILAMTVISDPLLTQLEAEAQACEAEHIEARRKAAGNPTKGQLADRQAAICMCSVLTSIKVHNKGKLPGAQLKNWWDAYGCK
jgi:hypothetical protein